MHSIIDHLKNKKLIWQANHIEQLANTNSTGFSELDIQLQGGFPQQGVVELESPTGIGELRLLLPDLRARQQSTDKLLAFIAPPAPVNSEMLAEFGFELSRVLVITPQSAQQALWCAEQCLASGCCYAVLTWHQALKVSHVKRMQLAAHKGDAIQFIFCPEKALHNALPVSLAMRLSHHRQGLNVEITKRKGGWPSSLFPINMRNSWPELTFNPTAKNIIPFPAKHSRAS